VIGLKQDVLTSTNTISVFNTTDFANVNSKIELTKNTSNYVDRINTTLTTVIGLKQDVLTSTNTISVFNTTDFANVNSKIELTKNTSNYVLSTSNILVPRIMQEVGFGSNYVLSTSNILVQGLTDEDKFTSNYVGRINTELTTTISDKTNTTHTHVIGDVSGLQGALDVKQATLSAGTGINISGNVISTYGSSWFNVTSGSAICQRCE
jgi:hypothetical protein